MTCVISTAFCLLGFRHQRTLAFKAEQVAQHANSVQQNINNVTTLKKQYLQEVPGCRSSKIHTFIFV